MIEIQRRTWYLLLAVLLGQVILISAQVNTSSGTRVLQAVTFGILSQVQLGTARLFGGVRSIWDGYGGLRNVHAENQRLQEELMAVRVRLQEYQALALRGRQLEGLLQLRSQTGLKTLAADVVGRGATPLLTVTIDRGSTHGLRKDMAVVAAEGVVGRIVEQPPLYAAKVQLLVDRDAGAGALVERSAAGGVVVGHDREGEPPLRMEYVSNLADVKVGDRVLTSGVDGLFPRGFTIGSVVRVERGRGLYKEIWLAPAVDFNAIGSVLVVLEPPAPEPSAPPAAPVAGVRR
jgi:rod shape-determining protein MreC